MAFQNAAKDLGHLFRARSFSHLKEIAATLEQEHLELIDLSSVEEVFFREESVDTIALSILKRENLDTQTIKPILTLGDGNSLFNAASMAICGSAKLATELRLSTTLELI